MFLHNDTLLSPHWLDGLLAAFDDSAVVAAGPRSNLAYGPQLIDAPYEVADRTGTDDFAWLWRLNHAAGRTPTKRLDSFCLAVRADDILFFNISPDGQSAAALMRDDQLKVWDTTTGRERFSTALDERLLAGRGDQAVGLIRSG